MNGPIGDNNHDQIVALVRQVDGHGPGGETDAEASVDGGGAAVDPPRYDDLAKADDEEEESIGK